MYNTLKAIAKKIIPNNILIKNEYLLRKVIVPFYKGNKHKCNVCNTKLDHFAKLGNGELICPVCGSTPRARRLYYLLLEEFIKPQELILDFSPSRILYKKLKLRNDIIYFASDFEDDFIADYKFDMRSMDIESDKFDLIICYHILEHISEDLDAMKELFRVLKKGGIVLIQTPYKDGEIYENSEAISPKERVEHFGQDNHVRIYSASGLVQRLESVGFTTEIRNMRRDEYFGFSENEKIIIAIK